MIARTGLSTFGAPPLAAMTLRALRSLVRLAAIVTRSTFHRMEVRRLLELDDRQLKDIGLTRNDVMGALAQPFPSDPSTLLLLDRSRDQRSRLRRVDEPRRVRPALAPARS